LATYRTTLTGREFVMAAFDPLGADIGIGPQAARARAMAAFGLDPLRALRWPRWRFTRRDVAL
jgi:hypothetical protein